MSTSNKKVSMEGINTYAKQLTSEEIAGNKHRRFVGGLWKQIGPLQLQFLRKAGLKPRHHLVDVGCGALRGGLHFVRYLDPGHYYGLDINASLIDAARMELEKASLADKHPHLILSDRFALEEFGVEFDYGIAVSLFTHLPVNHIIRCLVSVRRTLKTDGSFFGTFFEASAAAYMEPITHDPGGIVTQYDSDPFHYSFTEFQWMAANAGLQVERIGDWGHPRAQRMLRFFPPG